MPNRFTRVEVRTPLGQLSEGLGRVALVRDPLIAAAMLATGKASRVAGRLKHSVPRVDRAAA